MKEKCQQHKLVLEKQAEIDMLTSKFNIENKSLQMENNKLFDEIETLTNKFNKVEEAIKNKSDK